LLRYACSFDLGSALLNTKAKTDTDTTIAQIVVVPTGRPAAPPGDVVAGAAAQNAERTFINILTPLPHVPMHIVKSPCVRELLSYGVQHTIGILIVPSIILKLSYVIPETISPGTSGATGVFPFSFGRKSVDVTVLASGCKPVAIMESIVVTNIGYREIIITLKCGFSTGFKELIVFLISNLKFSYGKVPDSYFMLSFVRIPTSFGFRTPHKKNSAGD
jgi:hypothetical protein